MSKPKQRETPILTGPSNVPRRRKATGVRVTYDVGGGESIATRDHPTAVKWEITKHGQLVLRDKSGKQIARYRQFVWRVVLQMGNATPDEGEKSDDR